MLGGESTHFLILVTGVLFSCLGARLSMTGWSFALALSSLHLYRSREMKTQSRKAEKVRTPRAEPGFEPKVPPLCFCSWTPPI